MSRRTSAPSPGALPMFRLPPSIAFRISVSEKSLICPISSYQGAQLVFPTFGVFSKFGVVHSQDVIA